MFLKNIEKKSYFDIFILVTCSCVFLAVGVPMAAVRGRLLFLSEEYESESTKTDCTIIEIIKDGACGRGARSDRATSHNYGHLVSTPVCDKELYEVVEKCRVPREIKDRVGSTRTCYVHNSCREFKYKMNTGEHKLFFVFGIMFCSFCVMTVCCGVVHYVRQTNPNNDLRKSNVEPINKVENKKFELDTNCIIDTEESTSNYYRV